MKVERAHNMFKDKAKQAELKYVNKIFGVEKKREKVTKETSEKMKERADKEKEKQLKAR
jgi:hypothetical protein